MPPTKPQYRVRRADVDASAKLEAKEHPEFSDRTHRRLASDHLRRYGPSAYRAEPMTEKIVENMNHRMGAKPIKRKRREPDGPFFNPAMRDFNF
jgi:hypothetical protein